MFILGPRLGRIHTNMHMEAFPALEDPGVSKGHTVLDLGDDVFTRGRAHPMIDQRYRLDRIGKEAADPETAVILLDVVLGYGCNSDPGGEIAGALARIAPGDARQSTPAAGGPLVVASICGTREDPQGYDGQKRVLQSAGVVVAETNARACEVARGILKGD
jgi:FdrA protein